MRRRTAARVAGALACAAVCAIGASIWAVSSMRGAAASTEASPRAEHAADADGFPAVDWGYWKGVNPDVIGWITVPGTPIDYPVVQASAADPGHYLDHDVYGNWNYAGCPYLDAACAEGGLLGSKNAVVSGHNLGWGDEALFASIARYTDESFAAAHRTVLVQTPEAKQALQVAGAARIRGGEQVKRTEFSSEGDWRDYVARRLAECSVVLDEGAEDAEAMVTICTCSYVEWADDERTLVYATAERKGASI